MATIPKREAGDRSIKSSIRFIGRQSATSCQKGPRDPLSRHSTTSHKRVVSGEGVPRPPTCNPWLPKFGRRLFQQLPGNDQQLDLLGPLEDVEDLRVPGPLL